jgi:agmatine deiminase
LSEVQQRNPGVSREQLEQVFHDYLGIDQVLWMNRGCAGDDTHGHVDDITRFVGRTQLSQRLRRIVKMRTTCRWPRTSTV